MIKYFCDKCGEEIGEFEAYTILVEAPEIKSWADQYMYERRGYQVCRDCMANVADFIESKPKGKWIVNISDYKSVCSVCGANETGFIYGTEMWYGLGKSKFCPSCGVRMKGADDE